MNSRCRKLIEKARNSPKGTRFEELEAICRCLGMALDRIDGSHYIYLSQSPFFMVNIQKMKDGKAKPYQVKQVLEIIEEADLDLRK